MAQKAQTYIDKSGNSWLVFYDKDGDPDWNTWTTNRLSAKPNRIYKNEELGLEIGIGIRYATWNVSCTQGLLLWNRKLVTLRLG